MAAKQWRRFASIPHFRHPRLRPCRRPRLGPQSCNARAESGRKHSLDWRPCQTRASRPEQFADFTLRREVAGWCRSQPNSDLATTLPRTWAAARRPYARWSCRARDSDSAQTSRRQPPRSRGLTGEPVLPRSESGSRGHPSTAARSRLARRSQPSRLGSRQPARSKPCGRPTTGNFPPPIPLRAARDPTPRPVGHTHIHTHTHTHTLTNLLWHSTHIHVTKQFHSCLTWHKTWYGYNNCVQHYCLV